MCAGVHTILENISFNYWQSLMPVLVCAVMSSFCPSRESKVFAVIPVCTGTGSHACFLSKHGDNHTAGIVGICRGLHVAVWCSE